MAKQIDAGTLDLKEKVVAINRVAKVVKGSRTFPLPHWLSLATKTAR